MNILKKIVTDKDLLFLRESKKINDINLSIGSIIDNEEPGSINAIRVIMVMEIL